MGKFSLIVYALFGILNLFYTLSISCPQYQLDTLLEFKSLLFNHSKTSKKDDNNGQLWNSSISCCKWPGIACGIRGTVAELTPVSALIDDTSEVQMIITSESLNPIFRITSLTYLDLSGCQIQGVISGHGFANLSKLVQLLSELVQLLSELVQLDLSQNMFEGFIPGEIFTCLRYLQFLSMSKNSLQGNIPKEIENLTELQSLLLYENNLRGEVPITIFSLKRLELLNLHKNLLLSGDIPSEIGNLTDLNEINLNDMKLRGKLPSSMGKLENLVTLQVRNNDLYGEIPTWLFDLPQMRPFPTWIFNQTMLIRLDLSDNHLEEELPPWLARLDVGNLILSDNHLNGSLPVVDRLFHDGLYLLDLSRNNFQGELPLRIGKAKSISVLLLSGNQFSGSLPKSFSRLDQLQLLDLSHNNLSGGSDKFPVFCPSLQWIDISSNNFSGEVPTFSFPPTIRILSLAQNKFNGHMPTNLGTKLVQLQQLDLHDNNLTGQIPGSVSSLSLLEVLNLSNNEIEGLIPDELSTIPYLRILDLSNNRLKGIISSRLANISGMLETPDNLRQGSTIGITIDFLVVNLDCQCQDILVNWKHWKQPLSNRQIGLYSLLDLSKNQLPGQLPPSRNLKGLKLINVSHNALSGQIPGSFGDLDNVEILDLSHNKFSGEMPKTFSRLTEQNWLDVSNNQLSGPIPQSPQMDRINDPIFYANNTGLCGAQIQRPCSRIHEGAPPSLQSVEDENDHEKLFSWKFAGIGFPIGFLSTLCIAYILGFFQELATIMNYESSWSSLRLRWFQEYT